MVALGEHVFILQISEYAILYCFMKTNLRILCQILSKSLTENEVVVYMMGGLNHLIFPKGKSVSVLKMKYSTVGPVQPQ